MVCSSTGRLTGVDDPSEPVRGSGGMIKEILEELVCSVVQRSPYRRVLVSFYDQAITPAADSTAHVLDYAAEGLAEDDEREIRLFIAGGGIIRGDKYKPSFRISNSYYIPAGSVPSSVAPRIPSRRRFIRPQGWKASDLLLIPCQLNGEIIGQVSVDDPRDGERPTPAKLRELEELASVTAIALAEAQQREKMSVSHDLYSFLTDNAMTGVLIVQRRRVRYANDRALALFGYDRDELFAMQPWWQLFSPDDRITLRRSNEQPSPGDLETSGIRKDGGVVSLHLQLLAMDYEGAPALMLNILDISERVQTEELLKEKAFRDPLTGLYNRHYFDESIQRELKRSQRYKRPFTIMMTDLANFKRVNDQLGHQQGDRVLRDVANLVQGQVRESDWVIRYGGDEFLIVLPETGVQIEVLAERLRRVVSEWGDVNVPEVKIGIDIGWATWTSNTDFSLARLLKIADTNMYADKEKR
ncbi:MAG TPA: sensor domain-containing diguanylate cyclase [Candidatus Acetothermia bacterium]|nr:sensor domain-containing diguanylate cyclase [Candidatus Acetothermia bacterium]